MGDYKPSSPSLGILILPSQSPASPLPTFYLSWQIARGAIISFRDRHESYQTDERAVWFRSEMCFYQPNHALCTCRFLQLIKPCDRAIQYRPSNPAFNPRPVVMVCEVKDFAEGVGIRYCASCLDPWRAAAGPKGWPRVAGMGMGMSMGADIGTGTSTGTDNRTGTATARARAGDRVWVQVSGLDIGVDVSGEVSVFVWREESCVGVRVGTAVTVCQAGEKSRIAVLD
ncbi:hypothetical protein BJX70DRAFT_290684 [Aspergillus crustosus]